MRLILPLFGPIRLEISMKYLASLAFFASFSAFANDFLQANIEPKSFVLSVQCEASNTPLPCKIEYFRFVQSQRNGKMQTVPTKNYVVFTSMSLGTYAKTALETRKSIGGSPYILDDTKLVTLYTSPIEKDGTQFQAFGIDIPREGVFFTPWAN